MSAKRWVVFLISVVFCCSAKAQEDHISINFNNVSLETALTALITEQKVALSYNQDILPPGVVINKSFNNAPIKEIMDYLLAGTQLIYKVSGQGIIILPGKINHIILSGRIKDSISGEDLVGSTVYIPSLKQGVATNNYGYFSLLLPPGDYALSVSQVGYKKKAIPVSLKASQNQVIFLEQQTDSLKEIAVHQSDRDDTLLTFQPGTPFSLDFMQKHPAKGGDPDVLKSLQMQTGIERVSGSGSSFFVHGGNKDQNLILFDEAPVYNPAHLYGFVSVFNPDAVNHIQVYKNDIPANFGGRLSSVVDTRMNDGNNKEFHIKGGMSFSSARFSAEGPIVKDQGSFLVTFRRGLTDFFNEYFRLSKIKGTYYDFNLKLNYNLDAKNRVFYSTYAGFDHLLSRNQNQNDWGNFTSTLRWNHLFSDRLFSNISAIHSNYYNQLNINANKLTDRFTWDTGIRDLILKTDLTYYQTAGSIIKIGVNGTLHNFVPGESNQRFFSSIDGSIPRQRALENAAYISHQFEFQNKISINYGLRFSWFDNLKEPVQPDSASLSNYWRQTSASGKLYFKVEPRLSVLYKLSPSQRLSFAYNRNYQYLQLIQNDELSFSSLEMWLPADNRIAPQSADFYSTGYKVFFNAFSFSVNEYYKKMTGQLDLASHAQIILNPNVEGEIRSGRSNAYGTEINLLKTAGRLQGDLGYTWSRVSKRIETINNDQSYPANYDVPNDLKLALTYLLSSRLSLNSFFTYKTGRPVTLPVGYYYQNGVQVPIYEDKNASRLPDYNRLDISMELKPKAKNKGRHWQSSWVVSVYNVYNRKNPFYFGLGKTAKNNYSSGISPAISYNFKFLRMKAVFSSIIALIMLIAGCKNDITVPVAFKRPQKSYELAVEGSLNTLNNLQFVKLSKPAVLPDGQVTPVRGAPVSISDGNNLFILSETNTPGVYSGNVSDNKNYARSYSLKVHYNAKDYLATDTLVALQPDDLPFTATLLTNGQVELNIPAHIFGAIRPVQWLITYNGIQNWSPSVFNVQYPYTYSSQLGAPNAVYPLTQDGRIADLNPTDTVTVYKFSQSQSYAAFLYNLFQETDFKSIFSSEPGNVYGNVSGNAEGYFHCTDVSVTKYLAKNLVK